MTDPGTEVGDEWSRLLDVTSEVTTTLTNALDASEIVDVIVRTGAAGVGADHGVLACVRPGGALLPVATTGYARGEGELGAAGACDRHLFAAAALSAAPVWVTSRSEAAGRYPALLVGDSPSTNVWAAVPLSFGLEPFAVLGLTFRDVHSFPVSERWFLRSLAGLGALALAGARERSYEHPPDPSTAARLDNAINQTFAAGLVVVDAIDRIGDEAVANRLKEVVAALDVAISECHEAARAVVA